MTIYFYTTAEEYGCFSNFSRHGFELDGQYWKTSEHYFQAQKFAGTKYEDQVREARSPKDAANLGRRRDFPLRDDWETIKDDVMRRAVLKKFQTHDDIRDILLDTGDEELVENAPGDYYWGCGKDGTGKKYARHHPDGSSRKVEERVMTTSQSNNYFWQGKLVRLRPMHKNDVRLWLCEEHSDSEGVRTLNAGMDLPKSEQSAQEFAERYAEFNNRDERIMFSIETLDGELVGGINIHSMNQKNGTFETGSRIYTAFRDKGYALDAKLIVLRYAFYERRFQKYNIRCLETNTAMIKHATRLGCQAEGRIRRHIYTNGQYYDELIFGLTREEFDELNEKISS